jgi:hypothetical protein
VVSQRAMSYAARRSSTDGQVETSIGDDGVKLPGVPRTIQPSRRAPDSIELVASPAPRDTWREVVAQDPEALPSQTPEWVDTLPPRWADASRIYVAGDGRRVVVPMARNRHGRHVVQIAGSYPHGLGYGGAIADGGVTPDLLSSVVAELDREPHTSLTVWPNPVQAARWDAAVPTAWSRVTRRAHVVDLEGGIDAVWARMPGNGRRGVRKAENAGVTVETDTSGALLPTFFQLFAESQARWAAASHEPVWLARWRARHDSVATWRCISSALAGRCSVSVAFWNGSPVASIIVLHRPNAHYTHGAMRKELAGRSYANYALHWQAITDAVARGARSYHLGESGTSASLGRFKEQFGARGHDYAEYRDERIPLSTLDATVRRAVKRAIRFREPDDATVRIG